MRPRKKKGTSGNRKAKRRGEGKGPKGPPPAGPLRHPHKTPTQNRRGR